MSPKKVVIVGAGFGGLSAAKALGGKSNVEVLLVDRRNHHLFQPLLYQVATAGLSPADIAVPIRSEVSQFKNIEVHLDNVKAIHSAENKIETQESQISFDYLIMACGAKHSYFGKNEWEEFAPGLKTLEQATEIRRRVLSAFEAAENEMDTEVQKQFLTFVVIGGGPTGVELAGALAEISHRVLVQDFRRFNPDQARVILIEAGPRVLAMFSEKLSQRAERDLQKLKVEVKTNVRVTDVTAEGVVAGGEKIFARTVIWAAGVQPSSLSQTLGTELDRAGRVVVNKDLSLSKNKNIFVIGDQSHFDLGDGKTLPGLAPVAIQQGKFVAKNILRELQGQARLDFSYFDKGQMATIGKRKAVLQLGKIQFGGWLAWMSWLFIHIYFLVGFRNRITVLFQWAWSYVFTQSSARLIVSKSWKSFDSKNSD